MRESRSWSVLDPALATSTAWTTCSRAFALSLGGGPSGFGSWGGPSRLVKAARDGGTPTTSRTVSGELTTKAPTINATAPTATTTAAESTQNALLGSIGPAITAPSPRRRHRNAATSIASEDVGERGP